MSALDYALVSWGLANALLPLVCAVPFGRLMRRGRPRGLREENWDW
jgi:hypothetical protein